MCLACGYPRSGASYQVAVVRLDEDAAAGGGAAAAAASTALDPSPAPEYARHFAAARLRFEARPSAPFCCWKSCTRDDSTSHGIQTTREFSSVFGLNARFSFTPNFAECLTVKGPDDL